MSEKIFNKWWIKQLMLPLIVTILGGIVLFVFLEKNEKDTVTQFQPANSPVLVNSPDSEINYLGGEDSLLREYGSIASMLPVGSTQMIIAKGLENRNELMFETYTINGEKIVFKCDSFSLDRYKLVIEANPKFPFSYLALADCQKKLNEEDWVSNAKKAKEIFEITTKIPHHDASHDESLRIVNEMLTED